MRNSRGPSIEPWGTPHGKTEIAKRTQQHTILSNSTIQLVPNNSTINTYIIKSPNETGQIDLSSGEEKLMLKVIDLRKCEDIEKYKKRKDIFKGLTIK